MVPALAFRCPPITLNKVDLPAPLGPMTACVSPCATSMSTSRTAYTPPNVRETPATLSRTVTRVSPGGDGGELGLGPVGRLERAALDDVDRDVLRRQSRVVGRAVVVGAVGSGQGESLQRRLNLAGVGA